MQDGLKKELLAACYDMVNQRIVSITDAMQNVQAAANEETKSSAGDKYETGRAMMHLEKEKLSGQLAEASKMKRALDQIAPDKINETIALGSLVITGTVNYFISVSAGKITAAGNTFFAVSPASPIGQQVFGKTQGDQFALAGKTINILETY